MPSTAVIRYHDEPDTAAPAHVVFQPPPLTVAAMDTRVLTSMMPSRVASVEGLVRRRALQAAYLVTIGGATALNSFRAA